MKTGIADFNNKQYPNHNHTFYYLELVEYTVPGKIFKRKNISKQLIGGTETSLS